MTDSQHPPIELGLDTFGDVTNGPDGHPQPHAQVIRDVIEEAVLADRVGADFFGVGEHHRPDFAISSPETVLAAIAGRTARIRLGSAVTVLSSDDPVRVFQRFATLDAASNGRAEVILGRGSFTESFPLFGFPLDQYQVLFEEKLELFAAIRDADGTGEPLTWQSESGVTRAPLVRQTVVPGIEGAPTRRLRTWIGVGGSPESVVRAARYGLPLTLAIIGGDPRRFAPFIALYHRALEQLGTPRLPVAVHSPGHIADTDDEAREQLWPAYRVMHERIGRERGWAPITREAFEHEVEHGSMYVGAPTTVAAKIAATMNALGVRRFDMKYSAGPLAHPLLMRSIELYGSQVIPQVRALLNEP